MSKEDAYNTASRGVLSGKKIRGLSGRQKGSRREAVQTSMAAVFDRRGKEFIWDHNCRMMKEISSYRKGKAGMDAGGEEMDETDPLVKDTGGQEVQRKVLPPGL